MQKIAFPTDDGRVISAHLGQSRYFYVVSIEGDKIVASEMRDKERHQHAHGEHHHAQAEHHHEVEHRGPVGMFGPVNDCDVLIAGGMGTPAYNYAISMGMEVVLTGEKSIEAALEAYRAGNLDSDSRRVHAH